MNEIYKMGFINLLFYLYSNLYSFGYFSKVKNQPLINPMANVKSENSSMSISVSGEQSCEVVKLERW